MTEIFKDTDGQWRFRVKGGNNEIICTSEAYTRAEDAERGLLTLRRILTHTAGDPPRVVP